ncbi:unnamed protein product, partial [Amoebophrya sp. A120]|eukprot:GSA120T00025335001.1
MKTLAEGKKNKMTALGFLLTNCVVALFGSYGGRVAGAQTSATEAFWNDVQDAGIE